MALAMFLPILLFLLPGVSSDTKFTAMGNITCRWHHPVWCYSVALVERDWFKETDDILDTNGAWCRRTSKEPYFLQGVDDGDGPNDDFYELSIIIHHNCSNNGIRRIIKHITPTHVKTLDSKIFFSPEVTHKGVSADDYFYHN